MRLLFKYPTRGRPDWFKETLGAYYSKLSSKHEYVFVVTMDSDDLKMNNTPMRDWLNSQPRVLYDYGKHVTKIHACNADVPDDGWDILVMIADDMIPVVDGFDEIIVRDFEQHFPDLDGVVHYHDGLAGQALMTLPVLGRKFYQRTGFIYWPRYKAMWCDNEQMEFAQKLNKYYYNSNTIIRHFWGSVKRPQDEVNRKGEAHYHADRVVFDERKAAGFPVSFHPDDWRLRSIYRDKYDGRYLDTCAGDGITDSRTRILYEMGWSGIALEGDRQKADAFEKNYDTRRVKLLRAVIADVDGPTASGVDGIALKTITEKFGITSFDYIR